MTKSQIAKKRLCPRHMIARPGLPLHRSTGKEGKGNGRGYEGIVGRKRKGGLDKMGTRDGKLEWMEGTKVGKQDFKMLTCLCRLQKGSSLKIKSHKA